MSIPFVSDPRFIKLTDVFFQIALPEGEQGRRTPKKRFTNHI